MYIQIFLDCVQGLDVAANRTKSKKDLGNLDVVNVFHEDIGVECGFPVSGRYPGEGNSPTQVLLPGECHGTEEPSGYSPWGHRVGYDRATNKFTFVQISFEKSCVCGGGGGPSSCLQR